MSDPVIRAFFTEEYATWDDNYRAAAIDPVLNKVEQLLASEDVRIALGTVTSSIDFAEIMNTRKVFLANLSKGRLGPIHAQLLGALLASMFLASAHGRAETHPEEETRVPFYMLIDEAGTFTTEAFAETVSEAGKFKLSLILANQFCEQLLTRLRAALMTNVSNIIAFELSADDAESMAAQIGLQKKSAYLLTDLRPGETWIKHATYGGPLHTYMRDATRGNGTWRAGGLAQHVLRNTFERWRVEDKLRRFLMRSSGAGIPCTPTKVRDPWPRSLELFRSALTEAMKQDGGTIRVQADEYVVTDVQQVRSKFLGRQVSDADSADERDEDRERAFRRALHLAQQRRLIGAIERDGTQWIWPLK